VTKQKSKGSSNVGQKLTFGKKRVGKMKKKYGPKEEKPKTYRGQGR